MKEKYVLMLPLHPEYFYMTKINKKYTKTTLEQSKGGKGTIILN